MSIVGGRWDGSFVAYRPVGGLAVVLAPQHRVRGSEGINGVGLAVAPACGPVGTVDLDDGQVLTA